MKNKKPSKPYWEMTTAELREATKQFDEEFVGDKARPLSPEMKARWEKAKGEASTIGKAEQTIAVRLEEVLLKRCAPRLPRRNASPATR